MTFCTFQTVKSLVQQYTSQLRGAEHVEQLARPGISSKMLLPTPCQCFLGTGRDASSSPPSQANGHRRLKPSRRRLTTRQSYSSAICAKVTGTHELPDWIRPSSSSSGVLSPRSSRTAARSEEFCRKQLRGHIFQRVRNTRQGWLQRPWHLHHWRCQNRSHRRLSGVIQAQVTSLWAGNQTSNLASSFPTALRTALCSKGLEVVPVMKRDHLYSSLPRILVLTSTVTMPDGTPSIQISSF